MQTIKIEKLEELEGYEWEYKNKKFLLLDAVAFDDMLTLVEKNYIDVDGYMSEKRYRSFSLKNLTELEFYGLKVVLDEKPKLTREERKYIESEWYIARDKNKKLFLYHGYPNRNEEDEEWELNIEARAYALDMNRTLFPFITWESGKAWSKAELMELEVME